MRRHIDLDEVVPRINISPGEASNIVSARGLRGVALDIAKQIAEKNLTPIQAQAVLVRAWAELMRQGRITAPHPTVEKEELPDQT